MPCPDSPTMLTMKTYPANIGVLCSRARKCSSARSGVLLSHMARPALLYAESFSNAGDCSDVDSVAAGAKPSSAFETSDVDADVVVAVVFVAFVVMIVGAAVSPALVTSHFNLTTSLIERRSGAPSSYRPLMHTHTLQPQWHR